MNLFSENSQDNIQESQSFAQKSDEDQTLMLQSDKDMMQMVEKAFSRQGSMDVNSKTLDMDAKKFGLEMREHSKNSISQITESNILASKNKKLQ